MAVVIVAMGAIVLTAGGVLGVVYASHVITQSPQARARLRRQSFAAVERVYAVRRQAGHLRSRVGHQVRRVATMSTHRAPADRQRGFQSQQSPAVVADQVWPVAVAALRRARTNVRRLFAISRSRVADGTMHRPGETRADYLPARRLPAPPSSTR